MKMKAGLWVVVADGSHGLVLVNEGTAFEPDFKTLRVYAQDNPKTNEQGSAKPSRVFESMGARRSTTAAPDLHRRAEDQFVQQIMGDLADDAATGAFDSIVIVAPPVALGEMRKAVKGDLEKRIVAWIDKDFTNHPVPQITTAVTKILAG
jgi:protein required for attachment to host cells